MPALYDLAMNDNDIIICGSGAAEGIPAFFCECRVCREARERGGREIRGRTTYNFGGELHIDFGPDMLQAMQHHYPRLNKISHVLITHAHADHLSPMELMYHEKMFSNLADGSKLALYGTSPTEAMLKKYLPGKKNEWFGLECFGVEFRGVRAFEPFRIPELDAEVHPLKADHAIELDALIYIVTFRGRTVLFGNDTGYFPQETWDYLAALNNIRLDVAILDNTGTRGPWRQGHMGAAAVIDVFTGLEKLGIADSDTIRVVNHFSHNSGSTHAELLDFYEPKGIVVGYDGLTL